MTAPDRGATYQIALASTGSSTHDAWYPARRAALDPKPSLSRPGFAAHSGYWSIVTCRATLHMQIVIRSTQAAEASHARSRQENG